MLCEIHGKAATNVRRDKKVTAGGEGASRDGPCQLFSGAFYRIAFCRCGGRRIGAALCPFLSNRAGHFWVALFAHSPGSEHSAATLDRIHDYPAATSLY